jgi:TolA-binding protein
MSLHLSWLHAVALLAAASPAQPRFEEALAAEGPDPSQAAELYRQLMVEYPDSSYAGEALFRLAGIEDERNQHPAEALRLYRDYLKQQPNGRMATRAEARIAALAPYQGVSPALLQTYLDILAQGGSPQTRNDMQQFIDQHPEYPLLDDALFWLANATKGSHSRADREVDRTAARASLPVYQRILRDYPSTRHRLAVLKNLGDVYQTLGDYSKAVRYYRAVGQEGGEAGAALVQQPSTGANVKLWQWRFLLGSLLLMPLALLALVRAVPYRSEYRRAALKSGLKQSLRLLPIAALVAGAAFVITKPGEGGHTGAEPWLLTVCMAALIVFSFANGAIIGVDERQPVNLGLYLPALTTLILTSVYSVLYGLDLLSPLSRVFG